MLIDMYCRQKSLNLAKSCFTYAYIFIGMMARIFRALLCQWAPRWRSKKKTKSVKSLVQLPLLKSAESLVPLLLLLLHISASLQWITMQSHLLETLSAESQEIAALLSVEQVERVMQSVQDAYKSELQPGTTNALPNSAPSGYVEAHFSEHIMKM